MKIDGSCHCGAIAYEAEIDPAEVYICHCTDCQTLSGSAFRTVVPTGPGKFKLLSGPLTTYVKTAESGNRRAQAFCPTCGTSIYSAPVGAGENTVVIRVGTIRQRDRLTPTKQYWFRSAQPWVTALGSVDKVEKE
ncbi:MAG: GFA family protein [Alphaproteobacteria bacterium]